MAVLPIVIGQDTPVLRTKTQEVQVTKDIKKLVKDMLQTVEDAGGAGLAAPQIGKSLRLCIARINEKMTPLINPMITNRSENVDVMEEGCLSLPGIWRNIARSTEITLIYTDEDGKPQQRILKDFDARVVQHEVDHLDGVLIVDYAEHVLPIAESETN